MNNDIQQLNEELKTEYSGISASSLSWLDVSPLYFKKKLDKEIVDVETKATELGNQLHMYILEPNKFSDAYLYLNFDKPRSELQKEFCNNYIEEENSKKYLSDKPREDSDFAIEAYKKSYNTDKKSDSKIKEEATDLYLKLKPYITYLSEKDKYKGIISYNNLSYVREAKKCINSHDKASSLIYESGDDYVHNPDEYSANELKIYWKHPKLKINKKPLILKSIIDRLYIDHKEKIIRLIDIKTSGKLYIFNQKFEDYNYKRQMAFYWYAVEYLFKNIFPTKKIDEYKKETYIVALQTPDVIKRLPIECKVVKIKDDTVDKGKKEVNEYLSTLVWHFENNEWTHTKSYYENEGIDIIV